MSRKPVGRGRARSCRGTSRRRWPCSSSRPLLAAGCTVVIKPSPETVLDSLLLAEAIEEAGLPPGVVNIVPAGREVGRLPGRTPGRRQGRLHRLHRRGSHDRPALRRAAAPGDAGARRQVGGDRARRRRPLRRRRSAVRGDAAEQRPDVLPRHARARAALALRRDRSAVFTGLAEALQVGDSLDPETQIGPLASARQRDRVEGYIEKGRAEGARVVAGGGRPAGDGARLVRAADDLRRRREHAHDRPRGDLRAGARR